LLVGGWEVCHAPRVQPQPVEITLRRIEPVTPAPEPLLPAAIAEPGTLEFARQAAGWRVDARVLAQMMKIVQGGK
jgi:hypothetical protein